MGYKFVFGIEDKPKFYSEVAIFTESLIGYLENDDEICVVISNDNEEISNDLKKIGEIYKDKLIFLIGRNFRGNILDYTNYTINPGMNKIEALKVVSSYCKDDDMIIHTDSDLFLYKKFNKKCIPKKDTLSWNWIIEEDSKNRKDRSPFFTYGNKELKGIWTPELLEIMGCTMEYRGGGVSGFYTGKTLKNNKVVDDCFRFAHLLHTVANILGGESGSIKTNASDMPCYALSLTYNEIDYDVKEIEEFTVDNISDKKIKEGSFYHYYHDIRDGLYGAFYKSKWYKQMYYEKNLLLDEDLDKYFEESNSDHEKHFFNLAVKARNKINK